MLNCGCIIHDNLSVVRFECCLCADVTIKYVTQMQFHHTRLDTCKVTLICDQGTESNIHGLLGLWQCDVIKFTCVFCFHSDYVSYNLLMKGHKYYSCSQDSFRMLENVCAFQSRFSKFVSCPLPPIFCWVLSSTLKQSQRPHNRDFPIKYC